MACFDRQTSRPPSSWRPQPQPPRRRGPAVPAPSVPESSRRRDLLKAAYHSPGRLVRFLVAESVAADADRLVAHAAAIPPRDGRQGEARRLAIRIVRPRG